MDLAFRLRSAETKSSRTARSKTCTFMATDRLQSFCPIAAADAAVTATTTAAAAAAATTTTATTITTTTTTTSGITAYTYTIPTSTTTTVAVASTRTSTTTTTTTAAAAAVATTTTTTSTTTAVAATAALEEHLLCLLLMDLAFRLPSAETRSSRTARSKTWTFMMTDGLQWNCLLVSMWVRGANSGLYQDKLISFRQLEQHDGTGT